MTSRQRPPNTSRYEALLPLASGGMGDVWIGRANDRSGDSLVALKRALRTAEDANDATEAITREAVLASQIAHSNVVSVLDVDQTVDEEPVLVSAYVEGCTLAELFQREVPHIDARITTRIMLDAACGLAAAHRQGIIHRDVTPSNVFVGRDGVARIGDFGVAKSTRDRREVTEMGMLKGKPAYMAPEYVSGQRPNVLSDVFSLGVVAWEAYTGERLFKSRTDIETLARVLQQEIEPPSTRRAEVAMLDAVLMRALSRAPERRYAATVDFACALETAASAGGLLGTHAEVAAVVERVFGAHLEARRQRLRAACMEPPAFSEGRDYTATLSLVPPPPPRAARPITLRNSHAALLKSRIMLATATALATMLAAMATSGTRSLASPRQTGPALPASSIATAPFPPASSATPIVALPAPAVASTSVTSTPVTSAPVMSAPLVVISAPKPAPSSPRKTPASSPPSSASPASSPPQPAADLVPKRAPPNPYATPSPNAAGASR